MKVLILGPNLNQIGGVANYYNVIKLHEHEKVDYFPVNVNFEQNIYHSFFRLIYNYLIFTYKLSFKNYEIIHVNPSLDPKSFFRDSIFIIIGLLFKKKIIVFFHGWQEKTEKKIYHKLGYAVLFKMSFAKADVFIVLGEVFKQKLLKLKVNPYKKFIVETTIVDDSYIHKLDLNKKINTFNESISFLFLSRILEEKGIYIALNSYNKICEKNPQKKFKFIIAGDGPELKNTQQFVLDQKIKNVIFAGFVNGENKYKILEDSHILLFPTYYAEGLPTCILEAMLYGMPIISRITAAIPDWVESGVNGYLTTSTDSHHFASLAQNIINDKSLFKSMLETNHSIAKKKFTKTMIRERILSIYRNIV